MVLGQLRALLYLFAFGKNGFKIFDARRSKMLVWHGNPPRFGHSRNGLF